MANLLTETEVTQFLTAEPQWALVENEIARTFTCSTFPAAIALVNQVAEAAEAAQHHPDIDIRWRKVTFKLSTHSAGGLTAADTAMARTINQIAANQ
jgi:4a-hydroxytetrahydrobiopterin dehydratase